MEEFSRQDRVPAEAERKIHQSFIIMVLMLPLYCAMGLMSGSVVARDCTFGGLAMIALLLVCHFVEYKRPNSVCAEGDALLGLPETIVLGGMIGAVATLPILGLAWLVLML